jgi:hypothetical protein
MQFRGTLHIIGDSHSRCFENVPETQIHWLGAATAMNLWKKNVIIEKLILDSNEMDTFLFCFGEIDCRIHIYKISMETKLPEYILITNTVDTYISYINYLKKYRNLGIMAVPPQGTQGNHYKYEFYSDRKHRQQITDQVNNWLEDKCAISNIPFVDVWYTKRELERPLWRTQDFKEDECHIKNSVAGKLLMEYKNESR